MQPDSVNLIMSNLTLLNQVEFKVLNTIDLRYKVANAPWLHHRSRTKKGPLLQYNFCSSPNKTLEEDCSVIVGLETESVISGHNNTLLQQVTCSLNQSINQSINQQNNKHH